MLCQEGLPVVHLLCDECQYDTLLRGDFVFEAKTQKTALCNPIDAAAGLVEGQLQLQYLFVKLCGCARSRVGRKVMMESKDI